MFKCTECGECCRNLPNIPEFKNLHNGNGICNFLDKNICRVTLHQGKYHQVKRMFEHFSYKVIELHREKFAFLTLDNIEESSYRELTNEEVLNLKSLCKK